MSTFENISNYLASVLPLSTPLRKIILDLAFSDSDRESLSCICAIGHRRWTYHAPSVSAGDAIYMDPLYHITDTCRNYLKKALRDIHVKILGDKWISESERGDLCVIRISTLPLNQKDVPFAVATKSEQWAMVAPYIRYAPNAYYSAEYKHIEDAKKYQHQYTTLWTHTPLATSHRDHDTKICTPPWEEGDPWYAELKALVIHSLLREKPEDACHKAHLVPQEARTAHAEVKAAVRDARKARKKAAREARELE